MAESFRVAIEDPQPSQLFLSGRKLREASGWFDFDEPRYDPLPILTGDGPAFDDGELVLIDGHSRAYLAHLAGADELLVYDATDEGHPMELYADCIAWCKRKNLTGVADFTGRVVRHETYERRWIERCQRVANVISE